MVVRCFFLVVVLVGCLGVVSKADAQTITSTAQGGVWNDPASWIGGVVPKEKNDVVVNGRILIPYNQDGKQCNNLSITSIGIIEGEDGLTIFGNIINNGVIRQRALENTTENPTNGRPLKLFIYGDITNNGIWGADHDGTFTGYEDNQKRGYSGYVETVLSRYWYYQNLPHRIRKITASKKFGGRFVNPFSTPDLFWNTPLDDIAKLNVSYEAGSDLEFILFDNFSTSLWNMKGFSLQIKTSKLNNAPILWNVKNLHVPNGNHYYRIVGNVNIVGRMRIAADINGNIYVYDSLYISGGGVDGGVSVEGNVFIRGSGIILGGNAAASGGGFDYDEDPLSGWARGSIIFKGVTNQVLEVDNKYNLKCRIEIKCEIADGEEYTWIHQASTTAPERMLPEYRYSYMTIQTDNTQEYIADSRYGTYFCRVRMADGSIKTSRTVTIRSSTATVTPQSTSFTGKITAPPVPTGSPIANVRVALNTGQSTTTDAQGNYSFSNLPLGAYTITPTLQGYTFVPRDRVETLTAAQPSIITNFEARADAPARKPSISGNVTLPNGTGVNRVSIEGRLQGGGNRFESTDSRGFYTIAESDAGTYTVVPSLAGYTFTPPNRTVTLGSTNQEAVNFIANALPVQQPTLTLTISPEAEQTVSAGQSVRYTLTVRDASNQPVADATIAVTDNLQNPNRSLTTNAAGQVETTITVPASMAAGTYNVSFTATKMGFVASASVSRAIRVSALPPATSISGSVKIPAGVGIRGITVRLNTGQTATTEADGTYIIRNIPTGQYTVSVDVPNSYRLLGAPRQVQLSNTLPSATQQDFTLIRDAQQDELIKIYVIEKVPGMVKKVQLSGQSFDKQVASVFVRYTQSLTNSIASITKNDLNGFNDELKDIILFDAQDAIVGKVGFRYKNIDLQANRRKELIIILHNDLTSYQKHPIEKAGTPEPNGNPHWVFANWHNANSSLFGANQPITQSDNLYQTTLLIPPPDNAGHYSLTNVRPSKKPVIWIHGVTGTDGYWGNHETIIDPNVDTPNSGANGFNGKKDYPFTSYTGRFQRLDWVKDNCDVWEYYYPPDQAWRDSGYLLSRDIKEVVSKYGNQPASIVAHSMGGLVTRSYIEETAENYLPNGTSTGKASFGNDVDKVLFLGTPHHGSFGGTRLYREIFLSEMVQGWSSKDPYAPANRELGVGSMSIFELNNQKFNNNGVQYSQVSGTTWRGIIPAIQTSFQISNIILPTNTPVILESEYHSDGIVSISSASLLNQNIPLTLLEGFSHAHLNNPDISYQVVLGSLLTTGNRTRTFSDYGKQLIPNIAKNYLMGLTPLLTGTARFDPINTSDKGLSVIEKDIDYQIRTDIALPVVSFVNQSTKNLWIPQRMKPGLWASGLRFRVKIDKNNNSEYTTILSKEEMPLLSSYNDNDLFLYYAHNNFSESTFKYNSLSQVASSAFYAYQDNISENPFDKNVPVASQGVGWHLPLSAAPERKLSINVHLAYKFNKPVTQFVQIRPFPGTYRTTTEETQSYYLCKGKLNLQWCTTTYNNLEISDAAAAILESNLTLPNEIAGSVRGSSLIAQAIEQNNFKGQQAQLSAAADSLVNYVDADTRTASFVLSYGRNREPLMELVAPNGSIIRKEQANGTSILYHQDSVLQVKFFTVVSPQSGKWAVRVNGVSALPDTSYRLSYPMNVGQTLTLLADTTFLPRSTDSTRIRVQLTEATSNTMSVTNRQVSVIYQTIDNKTRTMLLRDDGRAGDDRANDGMFTGYFAPKELGTYTIGAYMTGQMNSTNFLRQAFTTIQIGSDSLQRVVAALPRGFCLLTPQNRASNISPASITFRWASAAPSAYYNFRIGADSSFSYSLFNEYYTDTSRTITGFALNRWYYWRVCPLGGDWSPVWSFYTGKLLAAAKALNDGAALSSSASSEPLRSFLSARNEDVSSILRLTQHPNPFSHTTTLEYLLPREAHVRMDVCNMLGQTLITLVSGTETAGAHTVDVTMDGFPSGVYVVRLNVGGQVLTRQMTLIR